MTIYEELKKDHKVVMGLLDRLVEAETADSQTRDDLISQIRDELIPHARAEEAVLYNSIRDIEGSSNVVTHAYKEHVEAETLLRSLQVTSAVNVHWGTGAKKLRDALAHHIKEEEGDVFSEAKKLFLDQEAEAMAEVFHSMKAMVKEQSLVGTSVDMLVNMMPSRLREVFGKFTAMSGGEAKAQ